MTAHDFVACAGVAADVDAAHVHTAARVDVERQVGFVLGAVQLRDRRLGIAQAETDDRLGHGQRVEMLAKDLHDAPRDDPKEPFL